MHATEENVRLQRIAERSEMEPLSLKAEFYQQNKGMYSKQKAKNQGMKERKYYDNSVQMS